MTRILRLSWPHKNLSSNARVHWAERSRRVKEQRREAWIIATKEGLRGIGPVSITFAYNPPDRRTRDAQNMPAMLKGAIDGLADAIGCDDSAFQVTFPSTFGEPVRGGEIVATIEKIG